MSLLISVFHFSQDVRSKGTHIQAIKESVERMKDECARAWRLDGNGGTIVAVKGEIFKGKTIAIRDSRE